MRSSESDSAAVTVSLPRRLVAAPLRAAGVLAGGVAPFFGASSSSSTTGRLRRGASAVAGSPFFSRDRECTRRNPRHVPATMMRRPPRSTLSPYATLFRSGRSSSAPLPLLRRPDGGGAALRPSPARPFSRDGARLPLRHACAPLLRHACALPPRPCAFRRRHVPWRGALPRRRDGGRPLRRACAPPLRRRGHRPARGGGLPSLRRSAGATPRRRDAPRVPERRHPAPAP